MYYLFHRRIFSDDIYADLRVYMQSVKRERVRNYGNATVLPRVLRLQVCKWDFTTINLGGYFVSSRLRALFRVAGKMRFRS